MTVLVETTKACSIAETNFVARHPLPSFFILAMVNSWLLCLPSLLFDLPFKPFQTAGAYGPLISAVIVSTAMGGS